MKVHVEAARRAIWLEVRSFGLHQGDWGFDQLPKHCALLPEVRELQDAVCRAVGERERPATQLLLRLPDRDDPWSRVQYEPHVDRTPEGGLYRRVVGVSLTPAPGGTARVGDAILGRVEGWVYDWAGDAEHCGILNFTSSPRLTAYWRFK